MRYFETMPIIDYNGVAVRDITRRAVLRSSYINYPFAFLPYTIHPGERPQDIAHVYYGSIDKTWVVFMSQQIIDPYYEWPMNNNEFADYLAAKYKTRAPEGVEPVEWTANSLYEDNILCYALKEDTDIRISIEGYKHLDGDAELYRPIRIHEEEEILNDSRRSIRLLDKAYVAQIEAQLRAAMVL